MASMKKIIIGIVLIKALTIERGIDCIASPISQIAITLKDSLLKTNLKT